MSKLIIIRGNSGSGKTTTAKRLRRKLLENTDKKVALIEQDYLRRIVLKEKDHIDNTDFPKLLDLVVKYALENNYITIVEGIFSKSKYKDYLLSLIDYVNNDSSVFYIDVPLEETLRRHGTKSNSDEFGEEEMKEWYMEKDYLGTDDEMIVRENSSLEESVNFIYAEVTKLGK